MKINFKSSRKWRIVYTQERWSLADLFLSRSNLLLFLLHLKKSPNLVCQSLSYRQNLFVHSRDTLFCLLCSQAKHVLHHFPHLLLLPHHCSCYIFLSFYLSQPPFPYSPSMLLPLFFSVTSSYFSSAKLPLFWLCSSTAFLHLHHPFPIFPVISISLFSNFPPATHVIFIAIFSPGCSPSTHLTLSLIQISLSWYFHAFCWVHPQIAAWMAEPKVRAVKWDQSPFPS